MLGQMMRSFISTRVTSKHLCILHWRPALEDQVQTPAIEKTLPCKGRPFSTTSKTGTSES